MVHAGSHNSSHLRVALVTLQKPCCRPALLLGAEFEHVPAARAALAQLFPDSDIDAMVQQVC